MADLKGQETARRTIEIAAAGHHNFLMIGPPGAGKPMLAGRFPGLLPALDAREALDDAAFCGWSVERVPPYTVASFS